MASLAQEAKQRQLALRILGRLAKGEEATGADLFGEIYGEYWTLRFLKRLRKQGLVVSSNPTAVGEAHRYKLAEAGKLDPYLTGPDKVALVEGLVWGRAALPDDLGGDVGPAESEPTDEPEPEEQDPEQVAEATLKLCAALLDHHEQLAKEVAELRSDVSMVAGALSSIGADIAALRKQWE